VRGLNECVEGEGAAGFALAVAIITAVNKEWGRCEAVPDRAASTATYKVGRGFCLVARAGSGGDAIMVH
jgi:hypothetical protein